MCVQWAEALQVFMRAADELGLVSRKSLWGQFWSSHQRFFKYLCIAAKVRCLVELAQKELEAGKVSAVDSWGLSHNIYDPVDYKWPGEYPSKNWNSIQIKYWGNLVD